MKEIFYKTWAIAWKNLLVLSKDRGELAILFLMPLLFASLIGISAGGGGDGDEPSAHFDIYVVNNDEGPYGEMVENILAEMPILRIESLDSAGEADQLVAKGERLAAVVIPADFSQQIDSYDPTKVTVVVDPVNQEYAGQVTGLVNYAVVPSTVRGELQHGIREVLNESGMLDEAPPEIRQAAEAQILGAIMTQLQVLETDPPISVTTEERVEESDEAFNPFAIVIPNFAVMFAFFLIGTIAQALHTEKDHGTFRRLLAAPLDRGAIVGGTMLAFMIVVFLQVIFMFGVAAGVFNMPLGNSAGGLLLITFALSLAAASLGLLLAATTRDGKQAGTLGMILGFVLAGLGGTIISFRIYEASGPLRIVGMLTPHAHAAEGFQRLTVDGLGLASVVPQGLILVGFAAVFFVAAMYLLKFE
ncbi:MAG: ABC transporter permease [Candidatus Promineifilaceae bacterium]|jgi:ABC-2 type transport system permease protein